MKFSSEQFWKQTPNIICTLWDSYLRLNGIGEVKGNKENKEHSQATNGEIVYRDGKPYIKKAAKDCDWTKSIF